jgi:histidinol dehydrogenase
MAPYLVHRLRPTRTRAIWRRSDLKGAAMPVFLNTTDADFETRFTALLSMKREDAPEVDDTVAAIIADVRGAGDAAVLELTERFDRMSLTADRLAFSGARSTRPSRRSRRMSARRWNWRRIASGPITNANCRSMNAGSTTPARRWAGAGRRSRRRGFMCPGGWQLPVLGPDERDPGAGGGGRAAGDLRADAGRGGEPAGLLAARLSGVDTVYRIGGAQAVAAMAYGTETIAPVDKITGPGNAYVAAAKRRVFGKVGIDMIAGPSEILVIADADNDPDWIAVDLLSQAEHDESAQSILITDDAASARLWRGGRRACETLERRAIAGPSWRDYGAVIVVRDLSEAAALSDRIAPEHLELCVADPEALFAGSPMPAPCSSANGRPRPSATISAGRTTSCPRPARRGFPRASRCWTS